MRTLLRRKTNTNVLLLCYVHNAASVPVSLLQRGEDTAAAAELRGGILMMFLRCAQCESLQQRGEGAACDLLVWRLGLVHV